MPLVAGVDCSTQATKVVVVDAATGQTVRSGVAPHPDATEVDPEVWWEAWLRASEGLLDGVAAVSVGGQQHGMVLLDESARVVRPALLWNDTRSAAAADALVAELGGPGAWAAAVGSVPVASFTVTKLRWVAEHEPARAAQAATVLLPHDWLTRRLMAAPATITDRGDASGTGYWSPATGAYREDLLQLAFGQGLDVPSVLAPGGVAGHTPAGQLVAAGTGDNMAAALGIGATPGDVIVSIGTSGTVFAVSDTATADASGAVAGFADATGHFLPLVCTLNAARILTATAAMLGVDVAALDDLALGAPSGAGGLTFLPYLDGERTPNLPHATGTLLGMTRDNMTPACLARAAVEGLLCSLAEGLEALRRAGVRVERALLIGGGSRARAVRTLASSVFELTVEVPAPDEYVARGAARQAAWALAQSPEPPRWPVSRGHTGAAGADTEGSRLRAQYAMARAAMYGGGD